MENDFSNISAKLCDLPQLALIEMPCFITSSEVGIGMLGGQKHIQKALRSGNYDPYSLSINFSPKDPLRQGILSQKISSNGILVRIIRKKNRKNDAITDQSSSRNEVVSVDIIGKVTRKIVFSSPADFQFLPTSTSTSMMYSPNPSLNKVLELIPRPFLIHSEKNEIELFIKKNKKKDYKPIETTQTSKSLAQRRYGDAIPNKTCTDFITRRNVNRFKEFYDIISNLFEMNPICSRRNIDKHVELQDSLYLVGEILPLIAFTYISGPWKNLWCRCGYDPLQNSDSRYLQVFS
eukprot:gene9959-20710_t